MANTIPSDMQQVGDPGHTQVVHRNIADVLSGLTGIPGGGAVPQGQGSNWNGAMWDPRQFGAIGDGVHDDTAFINAAVAAAPSAGGILNLAGAPVACAISSPITLKTGMTAVGAFQNAQAPPSKLDLLCLSNFTGIAAIADAGALSAVNTTPTSSYPLS